jgi:hypothetical protein
MRKAMTFLATAAFAFSLFSVAAVASGDSRSSGGRNGFGGHSDRYRLARHDRVDRHCYTPKEISKYPPWPPFCS